MAKYPAAIPTLDEIFKAIDHKDWTNASEWNDLRAELRAALVELGTDPAGAYADVKTRLDALAGGFIDRGDPAAFDFAVGDLTTDGAWHDLDLSAIVPAGAKAVSLFVLIRDNLIDKAFGVRKNGNTNIHSRSLFYTQVANIGFVGDMTVACDVNRVIEYHASATVWTSIFILVKGWWF